MDHSGHVAVVTGAAGGIGRDYAIALAEDGAAVVAADLNLEAAEETAALVTGKGGRCVAMAVDVSDPESTTALAARVRAEVGPANLLVNNAAIYGGMQLDPVLKVDIGYWRKMFSVNLDGALLMVQAFAPQLIESGWARVVNQTSVAAYSPAGAYSATKLALISLTQSQAMELGAHGIPVNAIAPGPILTEATMQTLSPERVDRMLSTAFIKTRSGPEALIGTLRYACGDEVAWVTGQTFVVDGGITRRV
ncbi:SDR family oxidoreductase [Nocardioides marmoriginsengisoli]|uniref:SDR family oxidoreductase n=1 Tax=Nocardioides marmoriginsengisoli TaxID=661483 RepID=A0A3N0CCA6_9ACTN|nr:SDR family oxidoreductase [Nocardioides marmoriginsengisoli]RNL61082.1 SDR family oxidoreductase [Nocardioides marmoriginsengisoli]